MDIWSEVLEPRFQAKTFGVPNSRTVILAKKWLSGRCEFLTEVSTTNNGKLYIVVF